MTTATDEKPIRGKDAWGTIEGRETLWANDEWQIVWNKHAAPEDVYAVRRATGATYGLEWRRDDGKWRPFELEDLTEILFDDPQRPATCATAVSARRLRIAGDVLVLRHSRR